MLDGPRDTGTTLNALVLELLLTALTLVVSQHHLLVVCGAIDAHARRQLLARAQEALGRDNAAHLALRALFRIQGGRALAFAAFLVKRLLQCVLRSVRRVTAESLSARLRESQGAIARVGFTDDLQQRFFAASAA